MKTNPRTRITRTTSETDTIVAVSTAPGRGAVGLVRISGPLTVSLIDHFCRSPSGKRIIPVARKSIYCYFLKRSNSGEDSDFSTDLDSAFFEDDSDGAVQDSPEILDDGLVTFFQGPNSYTGEDSAELSLHGNPLILKKIVQLLTSLSGVRPALSGEFTRRAYANGKLDLTQAESVRRLIDAKSQYELAASRKMLQGELSRRVSVIRSRLVGLKAESEAEVDFSTEDLTFESRELRRQSVLDLIQEIEQMLDASRRSNNIISGFQIALVGIPNAGKSSFLNKILGYDRAIVTQYAGTTRDYLAEEIDFEGIRISFVDTAGLRKTEDPVESEGIRRSHHEIRKSQMIFHIIDCSVSAYRLPDIINSHQNVIHLLNKSDIAHPEAWSAHSFENERCIEISCKNGQGMDAVFSFIRKWVAEEGGHSDPFYLEERHQYHFHRVVESLKALLVLWDQNAPDEISALEIDTALDHAGQITGQITTEEILGRIFSVFCVGK